MDWVDVLFGVFIGLDIGLYIASPSPQRITWWGYLPGGGIVTYFKLRRGEKVKND